MRLMRLVKGTWPRRIECTKTKYLSHHLPSRYETKGNPRKIRNKNSLQHIHDLIPSTFQAASDAGRTALGCGQSQVQCGRCFRRAAWHVPFWLGHRKSYFQAESAPRQHALDYRRPTHQAIWLDWQGGEGGTWPSADLQSVPLSVPDRTGQGDMREGGQGKQIAGSANADDVTGIPFPDGRSGQLSSDFQFYFIFA